MRNTSSEYEQSSAWVGQVSWYAKLIRDKIMGIALEHISNSYKQQID